MESVMDEGISFCAGDSVVTDLVCEKCGKSDNSVALRRGTYWFCWDCYRLMPRFLVSVAAEDPKKCKVCGGTNDLRKVFHQNEWLCRKHRYRGRGKQKHKPRTIPKQSCKVCSTTVGVRKYNCREEYYCKEHWPPRRVINLEKQPCKVCGAVDHIRKLRGKPEWYCPEHWPNEQYKCGIGCQCLTCGTTTLVRKRRGRDEWYCPEHWPYVLKHECGKCGIGEGIRKCPGEDRWYCPEHWPSKSRQKVCDVCGAVERVKKKRDRDEWYCPEHWPVEEITIEKHLCVACGITNDVRKWPNKLEWYCPEHWPERQRARPSSEHFHKPRQFAPITRDPCGKCGNKENVGRIVMSGACICKECAEKNHICLVCGDTMVEIGRKEKHYICIRGRQNGHVIGQVRSKISV